MGFHQRGSFVLIGGITINDLNAIVYDKPLPKFDRLLEIN